MNKDLETLFLEAPEILRDDADIVCQAIECFDDRVAATAARIRANATDSIEADTSPDISAFGEILQQCEEHQILAADLTRYIGDYRYKRREMFKRTTLIYGCASRLDQIAVKGAR